MAKLYGKNEGFINWAQDKIGDASWPGKPIGDEERIKLSKTIADLKKRRDIKVRKEMLDDEKYQSNKEEVEGEDQGYKDDYKEPSKEEASMEDQEGRYPLSAINRLTLNMLKV